jgi:hypothetical protein
MANLEDLLETSSVRETKPTFIAEYRLPGQNNETITIDIRRMISYSGSNRGMV